MVPRRWSILLIIVLSTVWRPGAAVTQSRFEGSASITGRVTDTEGKPLLNTKARAYNSLWDFERTVEAETSDGTFAIERLPFGEYDVIIEADAYAPVEHRVKVEAGETVWIEAALVPAEAIVCPEFPIGPDAREPEEDESTGPGESPGPADEKAYSGGLRPAV